VKGDDAFGTIKHGKGGQDQRIGYPVTANLTDTTISDRSTVSNPTLQGGQGFTDQQGHFLQTSEEYGAR
jgi:hypothetical protein